jgi:outer membrane protein assembly factor BamB
MTRILAGALAVLLVLAGCAGRNKDETEQPTPLEDIEQTLRIRKLWSAKLGEDAETLRLGLGPISDGSNVYAAARDGRVSAFDAKTGTRRWLTELEIPLSAGPGLGDGLLVIGSTDGRVVAMSASDGTVRWTRDVGAEVLARPLIAVGRVYVRTVDGHLRALDAATGVDSWNVQREVPRLSLRGNSTPVIAGDTIIAAFDDGKLIAVNLLSGDQVWETTITPERGRTEIERLADLDGDLRLVGNELYVAGYQSRVVKLAADSGQEQWSYETSSFEAPGVDWVHVYVTDEHSEVIALDRQTGAPVWRQSKLRLRGLTGPAPHGTAVVVGDYEGYLHWLSADDGRMLARVQADGGAVSNVPLVVGDVIYVQTDGGVLSAFTLVQ